MLRSDHSGPAAERASFVLYVEGPSDCEILRSWARLLSSSLARAVHDASVILGGRRPARAVEHFQRIERSGEADSDVRGLCVLDRDGNEAGDPGDSVLAGGGLDFFTWPRRHIESYLLIPAAIRRSIRSRDEARVADLLRGLLPNGGDETALCELDAKRLLAARGPLARELGRPISAVAVARNMHRSELHPHVESLLEDIGRRVRVNGR